MVNLHYMNRFFCRINQPDASGEAVRQIEEAVRQMEDCLKVFWETKSGEMMDKPDTEDKILSVDAFCVVWKTKTAAEEQGQEVQQMLKKVALVEGQEEQVVYLPDKVLDPVRKHLNRLDAVVRVPGSKSMTNRALLLAALSEGEVKLEGVLFSDDSRHFLSCLKKLGFQLTIMEADHSVLVKGEGGRIPEKEAVVNVGSAGTAARFITAMLALSEGKYTVECSKQMEKRPMKPLFEVLLKMGAGIEYLGEEGHLPVVITGNRYAGAEKTPEREKRQVKAVETQEREEQQTEHVRPFEQVLDMDISESTQFLSAMLMILPVGNRHTGIRITSEKKTGAYIAITMNMLKEFGAEVTFDGKEYGIHAGQRLGRRTYVIEPDVSAACYFFAAAAITGGCVTVKDVFLHSMQGDIRFLEVLKKLGCQVTEGTKGVCVRGSWNGQYEGVTLDMNNFSDQALTMAAVAAFAKSDTVLGNIAHIRGQECDRMQAIVSELCRCGMNASQSEKDITIRPAGAHGAVIRTYEDHRVAMAFTLLSLRVRDIVIENPLCCRKTFEDYFETFESLFRTIS